MFRLLNLCLLICSSINVCTGQSVHELNLDADAAYLANDFSTAEEFYKLSLEKEERYSSRFNLGNALFVQERFAESVEAFNKSFALAESNVQKSDCMHNIGNAYYQLGNIDKAIESYKASLRLRPNDLDTKYNLARVQIDKRNQQQQQQQQQENQKQNKEKEDQEQSEPQNKDEEKENKEQSEPQNKDEQQQSGEQKESQIQDFEAQQLDRSEATELLKIIEQEESNVRKKLKLKKSNPQKRDKDW